MSVEGGELGNVRVPSERVHDVKRDGIDFVHAESKCAKTVRPEKGVDVKMKSYPELRLTRGVTEGPTQVTATAVSSVASVALFAEVR